MFQKSGKVTLVELSLQTKGKVLVHVFELSLLHSPVTLKLETHFQEN